MQTPCICVTLEVMDLCDAKTLLREHKLKVTAQRELLVDTIIHWSSIFSATMLQEKLQDNMDLATIYRILGVLLETRIIREVTNKNNTQFYELSCEHNPVHPHFLCNKCNTLTCLNELGTQEIKGLKQNTSDYIIEEISIQFTGICPKCK